MEHNQESLDTLTEEWAFAVESYGGATFHFGVSEGHPYLIGVSFPFSAEFTSLFHLACVDGKGQKTKDYELLEPDMPSTFVMNTIVWMVELVGRFNRVLYKVSRAEVDREHRRYEEDEKSFGCAEYVPYRRFAPHVNPTQDWFKRAAQEGRA